MNKLNETVKELKADIKDLEDAFVQMTNGIDEEKKQKAMNFVEDTKAVINSSIEKVGTAIDKLKDEEKVNELLDKIKAKSKEAVDFALDKIEKIVNDDSSDDINKLHDEIIADFDKLKGTDIYKTTTVLVKEGYAKINEFLEKPEVKNTINNAKKKTISLAEKGVEGLKKVLEVKDEPKKKTKATKTTKAKTTTKSTKPKTTKKKTTK